MSDAKPGRPRIHGADEVILRATLELLTEEGLEATSIRAVAERSGVARATIYLRWPNRNALLAGALRYAIGGQPYEPTGDLAGDLRDGAVYVQALLSQPGFVAVYPAIVAAVLAPGTDPDRVTYDSLAPGRRRIAAEYVERAGATGLRQDVDPTLAVDLIVGAMFNQLLATGRPPSLAFAQQVADVVLAGLGVPKVSPARLPRSTSRSRGSRGPIRGSSASRSTARTSHPKPEEA